MFTRSVLNPLLAFASLLVMSIPVHGQSEAWLDIALDEQGAVTEAVVVDDVPPALVGSLRDWVTRQAFEPAAVDGRAVSSTTSVWVAFTVVEVDGGYELQVLKHNSGPRLIRWTAPHYPRDAFFAGQEGWVRLRFTVQPNGRASDIRVVESSHHNFEKQARRAMAKWRFKPKTVAGRAISTEVTQTIEFKLD
jgi:TonB family protein